MLNFNDYYLYNSIHRLHRTVTNYFNKNIKQIGLTINQFLMLQAIHENEGASISELGGLLSLDRTSSSRNIIRLTNMNLLKFKKGLDTRSKQILLTSDGEAIRIKANKLLDKILASLNEEIGLNNINELKLITDRASIKIESL